MVFRVLPRMLRGARVESPAARANPPACDHPKCRWCTQRITPWPIEWFLRVLTILGLGIWLVIGTGLSWVAWKLLGRWL